MRPELIEVLRKAASKIESSQSYQWGHMGLCNCGFLAQEVTSLTKEQIHSKAMQGHGDWTEQLNDYCPTSSLPMDHLISELLAFGFTRTELCHLEKLSDPTVLNGLSISERTLKHNVKTDVVLYMKVWANQLENKLLNSIQLHDLINNPPVVRSV
jgi:hypothetical protein